MSKLQTFYVCRHCGNIIEKIHDSGVLVVCCGEEMQVLEAQRADSTLEKHVPVIEQTGNQVKVIVGSVPHPMVENHYIMWIYLQTEKGFQYKKLNPGEAPELVFALTDDDKVVAAFEYCNIHGLWVAEA